MSISYFDARNVKPINYSGCVLPQYIGTILTELNWGGGDNRILDFGCGFGQNLLAIQNFLQQKGFNNFYLEGIDIDHQAISYCILQGLNVFKEDIFSYVPEKKYQLILLSHVLEHFPKEQIIPLLSHLKHNLLANDGRLLIMVPNAQSHTGCYWAYEDFTHHTLFTAGSLIYVLKMAGFNTIQIVDPHCLEGIKWYKKYIRYMALKIYEFKLYFWNKITSSSFHTPSPKIYSYEIKAIAF